MAYSAGGSRARGARPATDSGAGAFKIGDAERKANSLFGVYSAGGSQARGARSATDSAVYPATCNLQPGTFLGEWILDKKAF